MRRSGNGRRRDLFDIYKDTQKRLLKSRLRDQAALRPPEIAAYPAFNATNRTPSAGSATN